MGTETEQQPTALDELIPGRPPGTVPLLVRMPDGEQTQVNVPTSSTIEDVAATIAKNPSASEYFRLSFSNLDLDPTSSLLDTGILDAYNHAGSLLQLVSNASTDPSTRAAALDSVCAVVERISNGVTSMEALCEAAMNSNPSTNTQDNPDQQQQNQDIPPEGPPTPLELARSLTRKLPSLFLPNTSGTVEDLENPSTEGQTSNQQQNENNAENQHKQPGLNRQQSQLVLQPSISAIREARRRARAASPSVLQTPSNSQTNNDTSSIAANAYTIGASTYTIPLPADLSHVSSSPRTSALVTSNSGKSTWLEDIMTTWEVGAVRESGVLNGSKQGKEISEYFEGLEAEAQRELENEEIVAQNQQLDFMQKNGLHPGDSSDEEEEEEEETENDSDTPQATNSPKSTQPSNKNSSQGNTTNVNSTNSKLHDQSSISNREKTRNDIERGLREVDISIARIGLSDAPKQKNTFQNSQQNQTPPQMSSQPQSHSRPSHHNASVAINERSKIGNNLPKRHTANMQQNSLHHHQKQLTGAGNNRNTNQTSALDRNQLAGSINYPAVSAPQLVSSAIRTHDHPIMQPTPPSMQIPTINFNSSSNSTAQMSMSTVSPASSGTQGTREWTMSPQPHISQASNSLRLTAKIAPGPGPSSTTISNTTSPIGIPNGIFQSHDFPSVPGVPESSWHNDAMAKGPKKRGRKRKYPQLTDEERALVRKQQNRESAKLSRVRRKAIAAEYEERLSSVINENSLLRKQVAGLNDRLEYLQGLLTVSVRCETPPDHAGNPMPHNMDASPKPF